MPTTTTVAALSDQRLLQQVRELSAIEHYVQGVVIDHLREVERRGLYLTLGFSGMFDYAMRELGYSTGAAWRRLKAMRLCGEVNGARGRLLEGTLTLDAAAQLQYAFEQQERKARRSTTPDTEKQAGGGLGTQADAGSATPVMEPGAWAGVVPGGSAADVAAREAGPAAGAAGAPSGLEPDAPVRSPERPVAPVLDAAARESLVAAAAGKSTRQVKEMLAKVDPDLARAADRMRPLGAGRWELKAVIDDDCQVGLEQLKGLLSHVDPQMTLGQLLGRVVREALDRHDPSRPPRGRGRSRRTPEVADQTSAPKTAAGRDAAAAPQSGMPAGSATSAPKVPADAGQRRVPVAKRLRWPPGPRPPRRRLRRRKRLWRRRGPSFRQARRLRQPRFRQRTGPRQPPDSPLRCRRQAAARSPRRIGPAGSSRRRLHRRRRASAGALFRRP